MPTFPPPPLSFRTADFPQYGWEAGISDSAFARVARVKATGMPRALPLLLLSIFALFAENASLAQGDETKIIALENLWNQIQINRQVGACCARLHLQLQHNETKRCSATLSSLNPSVTKPHNKKEGT